jgi:hypothetical protein
MPVQPASEVESKPPPTEGGWFEPSGRHVQDERLAWPRFADIHKH